MTCGRTDHTKFASAPRAEARKPAPQRPGTYDNRATMCREHWGWDERTQQMSLVYSVSYDYVQRRGTGYERRPWGDFPDLDLDGYELNPSDMFNSYGRGL